MLGHEIDHRGGDGVRVFGCHEVQVRDLPLGRKGRQQPARILVEVGRHQGEPLLLQGEQPPASFMDAALAHRQGDAAFSQGTTTHRPFLEAMAERLIIGWSGHRGLRLPLLRQRQASTARGRCGLVRSSRCLWSLP